MNNKKLLLQFLFILLTKISFAQYGQINQNELLFGGGFGLTWINGQPHYAFRFYPEFQFSKIGIGLDLNLEFTSSGKIRTENFNEFTDYLSIIRYVRYGYKHDPLYFRIGALDYATLGHGSIIYLYNNSPTFDARKIGMEFDMDFDKFGFETIYGNFGKSGLIGIRSYVRPMQFTDLSSIPVLGKLEIGTTLSTDADDKSGIISGEYNPVNNTFLPLEDEGNITIVGLDVGLPLLRTKIFNLDIYYDYAKIIKFGSGSALGTIIDFNGINLLTMKFRFERRFNNEQYLPSYFNSLYEIERFKIDYKSNNVISKIQKLKIANEGNGYFGEMLISLLGNFNIIGSFQKLDRQSNSGIMHIWTVVNPENFPYMFRAGYDKVSIKNFRDIFKMDDRSFLFVETGYKINKYLLFSMIYYWTYTPVRDKTDNIVGYKTQKKVEPRISFIYPLSLSK
ncbi:hypothetical protein [Rosettibacter firmus]|uniref:hypothetical protein n=1 Tax=Rosettibacter firmus TaxID=3111522 RepID=UPI00336BC867